MKKIIFTSILLFSLILIPVNVFAAKIYLSPSTYSYGVGQEFDVDVNVSSDISMNTAESEISFDPSSVNVVSVSTQGSPFTIWVTYPTFSNTTGKINFSGGIPFPGITGIAKVFTIKFKSLKQGSSDITFGSGEVLANDGSGTNILSESSGASYSYVYAPLFVSCTNSATSTVNQKAVFSSKASGGSGVYTYSWTGDCINKTSSCEKTFQEIGKKQSKITVTSGDSTATADCTINTVNPALSVTCSYLPEDPQTNSEIIFSAKAQGASAPYNYSFTGDCQSSSDTCKSTFTTSGDKSAKVTVTSGSEKSSATCSLNVRQSCDCVNASQGGSSAYISGTNSGKSICYQGKCVKAYIGGQDDCSQDTDCQGVGFSSTENTETRSMISTDFLKTSQNMILGTVSSIVEKVVVVKETVKSPVVSSAVKTVSVVCMTAGVSPLFVLRIAFMILGLFGVKREQYSPSKSVKMMFKILFMTGFVLSIFDLWANPGIVTLSLLSAYVISMLFVLRRNLKGMSDVWY